MGYRIVVAGATGNVGREMLNILAEREFPLADIAVVASSRSQGDEIDFGDTGRKLKVRNIDNFDPTGWDMALFAIGSDATKIHAPRFAAAGCTVIDNSSLYRMDPDVPLIVPEVNPDAIAGYTKRNIIANPNCSTAQLVVALKPLHDKATITRVVVSTYQSVSGAGKDAMDELFSQTKAVYTNDELINKKFPKRIAFNVIPQIDVFMEDGFTKEEWKMMAETKKILDPKIKLTATCVRVPVFVGHSEAVNVEFANPITADEARNILRNAPGCLVIDKHEPGGYVTPYEAAGEDATYISRIREDATVENGLAFWCVSDNLRKGAAVFVKSMRAHLGLVATKRTKALYRSLGAVAFVGKSKKIVAQAKPRDGYQTEIPTAKGSKRVDPRKYAHIVEGGRKEVVAVNKTVLSDGTTVFGGKVKSVPARPFARPAYDTKKDEAEEVIADGIKADIEKAIAKGKM